MSIPQMYLLLFGILALAMILAAIVVGKPPRAEERPESEENGGRDYPVFYRLNSFPPTEPDQTTGVGGGTFGRSVQSRAS